MEGSSAADGLWCTKRLSLGFSWLRCRNVAPSNELRSGADCGLSLLPFLRCGCSQA